MSSDFERLVGFSNNQQRAEGYPPQPLRRSVDNSNPFLIDDGEDYDDTPTTDSRFRQAPAAGSSNSGSGPTSTYPYSYGQQPPLPAGGYGAPRLQRDLLSDDPLDMSHTLGRAASTGSKKSTYGTGQPQGWTFDQDDPYSPAGAGVGAGSSATVLGPGGSSGGLPFAGSKTFNGVGSTDDLRVSKKGGGTGGLGGIWKSLGQGRLPWQKEKVLMGERIIFLNDSRGNGEQGFVSNYVSTTKYNLVTFMPKFLVGEFYAQLRFCGSEAGRVRVADVNARAEKFSNYANLFFLFTGMSSG